VHDLFRDPETLSSLLDPEKDAKPERGFDFWVEQRFIAAFKRFERLQPLRAAVVCRPEGLLHPLPDECRVHQLSVSGASRL
jgi:hypothetical protein